MSNFQFVIAILATVVVMVVLLSFDNYYSHQQYMHYIEGLANSCSNALTYNQFTGQH